jgi:hypothetical protein
VSAAAAGKSVKCPACAKAVRVPVPAAAGASRDRTAARDDISELLDEADLGRSRTGRRCPECRQDLELDDVLCINCGYNTETGKKLETKKVEQRRRVGNVLIHAPAKGAKNAEKAPKPVQSLVKLLNQAGAIFLLIAVGIVVFRGYQAMQARPADGISALIDSLTASGLYVIGGAVVLLVLPFALAANLVQSGKAVGRILSIVMGIVAVPILLGVLIIKLSLTDEVTRYCQ